MRKFILLTCVMLFVVPFNVRNAEPYYFEFLGKIIRFEKHHDPFVRDLLGCPREGLIDDEHCSSGRATLNYKEYNAARQAAADLYDLKLK